MARKQRIDSTAQAVKVLQAAACVSLKPPEHIELDEQDQPFWDNIMAERARSEWSQTDLELAALLARSMRKLIEEQNQLEDEGSVLYSDKGNAYGNPRARMVNDLSSRVLKYRLALGLNSRAKHGEPRDVQKRRGMAKEIESVVEGHDPLFARPTFQ